MASDETESADDILEEAKEAFQDAVDTEADNRNAALDDLRFGRLGEQWPTQVKDKRKNRPCLTINKMPAFIRQVTNDARQNKPQIKVRPVDDEADVHTAEVYSGIIRNIENISNADVAYDTAGEHAVGQGFGYFAVDIQYAHDDTFDRDLIIRAIPNPFSIYGDPNSTAADSSDWNSAFEIDWMLKSDFKKLYGDRVEADWDSQAYKGLGPNWITDDKIMLAAWWCREEVQRKIYLLANGEIVDDSTWKNIRDEYAAMGIVPRQERNVSSYQVTHYLLTGAELIETTPWAGRYIPIIPVYGDEVNEEGKRHFRSLIRDAKDAQQMFNLWRSTSTELVGMFPKAPWVGPEKAFTGAYAHRWENANTENYTFLAYGGDTPPQRAELGNPPVAAMQEALNASDDMKAIIGLYDAALGARSNETSGRAIIARQREGDVSTFHFIDNLSRAIRHCGKILIDLIPHVYTGQRMVRILGAEGQVATAPLGNRTPAPAMANSPVPAMANGSVPTPSPLPAQPPLPAGQGVPWPPKPQFGDVFDLSVGKYDLVVDVGPSYTTRRAEAADQMMQLLKAFPAAAPVVGDIFAKNLDWPGAQEIADRLHKLLHPALQTGPDGQPIQQGPPPPDPKMIAAHATGQANVMKAQQAPLIAAGQALLAAKADIEKARINAAAQIVSALIKAGSATDQNIHQILADVWMDTQGQQTALAQTHMTNQANLASQAMPDPNAPMSGTGAPPAPQGVAP